MIDLLDADAPTVPQGDIVWLMDLLSAVAAPHTNFRIAPAPQRHRSNGILFDALSREFSKLDDAAVEKELTQIVKLFNKLAHHSVDPLDAENKQTLLKVVRLIRKQLLHEYSAVQRPVLP
jgi:hypothetical protein